MAPVVADATPAAKGSAVADEKPAKKAEVLTAHVVVKLPENATLYVDDTLCTLSSATRAFDTPELKPGQKYSYTLRAEIMRDGRQVTESKKVIFKAGEETVVEFGKMQTVETAGR
jgi:uncharacterized protein (TIGR03000 family)